MDRYFVDTYDGRSWVSDIDGSLFDGVLTACRVARRALLDMISDEMPDVGKTNYHVRLRDRGGALIFQASLGFDTEVPCRLTAELLGTATLSAQGAI